jgi:hypothetical protein
MSAYRGSTPYTLLDFVLVDKEARGSAQTGRRLLPAVRKSLTFFFRRKPDSLQSRLLLAGNWRGTQQGGDSLQRTAHPQPRDGNSGRIYW